MHNIHHPLAQGTTTLPRTKETRAKPSKQGRNKGGTKQPVVTIAMMDDAATMLSKELGKYVSYGQVQKDLAIGKLVVSGGRIVKAGDRK